MHRQSKFFKKLLMSFHNLFPAFDEMETDIFQYWKNNLSLHWKLNLETVNQVIEDNPSFWNVHFYCGTIMGIIYSREVFTEPNSPIVA
jgi:hypothetical protein